MNERTIDSTVALYKLGRKRKCRLRLDDLPVEGTPLLAWLGRWRLRLAAEDGWSLALTLVSHPRSEATADEVVTTGGKLQLSIWHAVVSPASAPIVPSETEVKVQTSIVSAVFNSLICYILVMTEACGFVCRAM